MFHWNIGLLGIALRTLIVYGALLLGLRLAGKREAGQMTNFDLIVLLLISNAVQNAMVGPDTSVSGGLVAVAVLLLVNRLVAWSRLRYPRLRPLVEGVPTVLIQDGRWVDAGLRHEGMTREEVEMGLREHGIEDMADVRRATLELDGSISVVTVRIQTEAHPRRRARFIRHPG